MDAEATATQSATMSGDGDNMPTTSARKVVQAPSACPFSGVAIDPAMWESFQAKLATNNHHHHHRGGDSDEPSTMSSDKTEDDYRAEAEEKSEGRSSSLSSRSLSPPRPILRRSKTNNYRVKVVNDTTKRSKDVLVDRNGSVNLFHAVYNHPSVKEAHVRKWGPDIVDKVKAGHCEIKAKLVVGGDAHSHWFTVDELKETTTKELYQMIEDHQTMQSVELHLVCVPNESTSQDATNEEKAALPIEQNMNSGRGDPTHETPSPSIMNTTSNFRVRVVNQTTKRSKDLVLDKNQNDNLFDAVYNHPSVKEAHVRKWGLETAKQVKSGQAEIQVKIAVGEDSFCRWFTVDELKKKQTQLLYEMIEEQQSTDPLVFHLVCVLKEDTTNLGDQPPVGKRDAPAVTAANSVQQTTTKLHGDAPLSTAVDSAGQTAKQSAGKETVEKTVQRDSSHPNAAPRRVKLRMASTRNFHCSVINQTTKRSKDLVLDGSGNNNLYDTVYNHPSVKHANIRKWGSEISKQVKSGQSEIRVKITAGEDAFCRWFNVDELKEIRTNYLYEMIQGQKRIDTLAFHLVCVPLPATSVEGEESADPPIVVVQDQNAAEADPAEQTPMQSAAKEIGEEIGQGESSASHVLPKAHGLAPSTAALGTATRNVGICVMNQTTNRSKDMVLERSSIDSLYSAIYDHPSVKEAHVRKWGSEVAKQVKSGQSEIKVKIEVADFCRWFKVDELKETTIQQLYETIEDHQNGDGDAVVFSLVCVSIDAASDIDSQNQESTLKKEAAEASGHAGNALKQSPSEAKEDGESSELAFKGSTEALATPTIAPTSNFRIRVVNQTTKRSKDMLLSKSGSENLFNAIYNHPSVKQAHIRKWGSEIAKEVKSGQSEIRVKVVVGEDSFCKWFMVDELKETTTQQLYEMIMGVEGTGSLVFYLTCVPKGAILDSLDMAKQPDEVPLAASCDGQEKSMEANVSNSTVGRRRSSLAFSSLRKHSFDSDCPPERPPTPTQGSMNEESMKLMRTVSVATSSHVDSTMSDPSLSVSMMDADLHTQKLKTLAPMQDQAKTTLGVRVINKTTQRHKDLVVHISDTNTVFEMVYDHPGVKSAHVRKWGGPIAKAVKNGIAEIKFMVWDDDTQKPWKVFAIDELKSTTTRQLYELVSESSNLIKIYLQCVSASDGSPYPRPSALSAVAAPTSLPPKAKSNADNPLSNTSEASCEQKDNEAAIQTITEHKVMPLVPIGPKRQASLRLGKTGRPTHAVRPRRQASLRLEKHGRPQFSIETSDPTPKKAEQVKPMKKPRSNHMKWLAAHIPRNGSCPTMQQMVTMHQNGAIQRRVGSHDGLEGLQSAPPQYLASSKSACSNSSLLRQALKTKGQASCFVMSALGGSKNDSSKNATWQATKAAGNQRKGATNKLLASLKQSAPSATAAAKPPAKAEAQTQSERVEEPEEVVPKEPPCVKQSNPTAEHKKATMRSNSADTPPRRQTLFGPQLLGLLDDSRKSLPSASTTSSRRARRRRSKKSSINRVTSLDDVPPEDEPIIKPRLKRIGSDPLSLGSMKINENEEKSRKLKEFMRLLRAKKLPEFQSQRSLGKKKRSSNSLFGSEESQGSIPSIPSMVQMGQSEANNHSALTLSDKTSVCSPHQRRTSTASGNVSITSSVQTPQDKINRFLRLKPSQSTSKTKTSDKIARFLGLQKSSASEETATRRVSWCEPDDMDRSVSISTKRSAPNQYCVGKPPPVDMPPLKEISVNLNDDHEAPAPVSTPGIALSPSVVKDVFPYHVVVDADFRIIQVGNNLEMLVQESGLVGRYVSDIMTITSPIPIFGSWDWNLLEKMKDKTIFLESVLSPAMDEKVKLKGTLIEVSKSSKQVMLALFPNVKNLAELEEANLSMADLPLHSCQREAVLLGEHSKSEVNLTNHLDKLHRDLIDSMEQQIKDRTEELAAANRQLETANSRLAIQSARQLEHFACMSHEIRTPLNCIVGMSSLLLDDAEEMDPMHSDSIRMINTSGDLLKAVVDDVLDYAKLESGSFEVDIKEADLQHTLNSVAHSISQKVQDKNIRLRLHYSPFLPDKVETDSRRLQQVLFNLLGNAGKFSKINSVIDLSVTVVPVASTDVDPDETSKGEVIRFAVTDYGKGIEEKDFKTIFEPFSQASKETQNVYGGTGLGLSITSKLVHRLGGTVSLKSEYGKYTEFTVDLPLRGKEVNVPKLQRRLRNTTLVLVEPPTTYDYSFTDYAIKPEPFPFRASVAEAYKLNVIRCDTIDDVFEKMKTEKLAEPAKHFAFLVHEDLYQFGLFDRLEKLVCRLNYTLMTFGPQYSVEMTKDRHFKSLSEVFPSAMLEKIAETMERRKVEKMFSNRNLSVHGSDTLADPAPASQTAEQDSSHPKGSLFSMLNSPSTVGENGNVSSGNNTKSGGLFSLATPNADAQPGNTTQVVSQPSTAAQSNAVKRPSGKQQRRSLVRLGLKILYAEDNKINQKVLSRVLARSGITNLTIVENGKEAVEMSKKEAYDIIFMDAQMPIMGGLEATKLITERNPSERVVFVTAHGVDEFKSKADAVGATGFLSKPFRPDDIEKLLEELGFYSGTPAMDSSASNGEAESRSGNSTTDGLFSTAAVVSPKTDESTASLPSVALQPSGNRKSGTVATQQSHSAGRVSLKVLYAEDNKINQKVLARVLKRCGINNCQIVDNGKKAVDITETQKFDIIFMDYEMPIMDGMEATKLIMERDPSEKVVFVTAHALDEYKTKADAVGATGFLSKPVRPDDIEKVLVDLGYSKASKKGESSKTIDTKQAGGPCGGESKGGALFNIPNQKESDSTSKSGALFNIPNQNESSNLSSKGALFTIPRQGESCDLSKSGGLFTIPKTESSSSNSGALFTMPKKDVSSNLSKSGGLFAIPKTESSSMSNSGGLFAMQNESSIPAKSGGLFAIPKTESSSTSNSDGLFAIQQKTESSGTSDSGGLFTIPKQNESSKVPSAMPNTQPHPSSSEPQSSSSNAEPQSQSSPTKKTAAKQNNHSAARQALKVLYAEDNKVNQKVLSRVLTRSGISNITIVEDGEQAVEMSKKESYDLIFMDVQMPIMGGMEATKLIVERNPSEKVIFVTAHALDEFKVQATAVGATSFISKPFRLDDIEKVLKELGY